MRVFHLEWQRLERGSHHDCLMTVELVAVGAKGKCFCRINFMLSKEEQREWLKEKTGCLRKP